VFLEFPAHRQREATSTNVSEPAVQVLIVLQRAPSQFPQLLSLTAASPQLMRLIARAPQNHPQNHPQRHVQNVPQNHPQNHPSTQKYFCPPPPLSQHLLAPCAAATLEGFLDAHLDPHMPLGAHAQVSSRAHYACLSQKNLYLRAQPQKLAQSCRLTRQI
jgi:hypothetical protein